MGAPIHKRHIGIILEPSRVGFDSRASTFACAFVNEEQPDTTYLFYSGAKDARLSRSAIGVAVSTNGREFRKATDINPIVEGGNGQFNWGQSLTPAVVRVGNRYYMFFAGGAPLSRFPPFTRTRIGVAYADDPLGSWEVLGVIAKPERYWEGWALDLGPSVVKLTEKEVLVYYSNVNNRIPLNIVWPQYWRRSIGILKVKIASPRSIVALKYEGNPLKHINGPTGSQNESLFCPGYLPVDGRSFLMPSMSTYSVGFPYPQYIGLVSDSEPYFKQTKTVQTLIDGPTEKSEMLPSVVSEIGLDTPCPVIKGNEVYLYYSVVDRHDGIWKIGLSIVNKASIEKKPHS